jgi:hypothetical protein
MLKIIGCAYCLIGFLMLVLSIIGLCVYRANGVKWRIRDAVFDTITSTILWPLAIANILSGNVQKRNKYYEQLCESVYSEKSDL